MFEAKLVAEGCDGYMNIKLLKYTEGRSLAAIKSIKNNDKHKKMVQALMKCCKDQKAKNKDLIERARLVVDLPVENEDLETVVEEATKDPWAHENIFQQRMRTALQKQNRKYILKTIIIRMNQPTEIYMLTET